MIHINKLYWLPKIEQNKKKNIKAKLKNLEIYFFFIIEFLKFIFIVEGNLN